MALHIRKRFSLRDFCPLVGLFVLILVLVIFIYQTISYPYRSFNFAVSEDYIAPAYLLPGQAVLKPAVPSRGTIYLTFDDGPSAYTPKLLDVLAKYNVKATFFVVNIGDTATIKREYDEGHTVALHSATHNYSYVYSSLDNYFADLNKVQTKVEQITGVKTYLMRFPGGSSNTVSRRYDGGTHIMSKLSQEVVKRGFTYFDWNVLSGDADVAKTSDAVYNNVISTLKTSGSSVVLQHDTKEFSVDAVERIIRYGLDHNYIFAPLDSKSPTAHHRVNN